MKTLGLIFKLLADGGEEKNPPDYITAQIYHIPRVSDQGGGIDRATADKIFKYLYTTAPKVRNEDKQKNILRKGKDMWC